MPVETKLLVEETTKRPVTEEQATYAMQKVIDNILSDELLRDLYDHCEIGKQGDDSCVKVYLREAIPDHVIPRHDWNGVPIIYELDGEIIRE